MSPGIIPHHRHYGDINAVEMFPGVTRRTLVSGVNATLVEIRLAANAEVPEHTHPHEQAGYVATGRVVLRFSDGEERELAAGASYLIPGGEPHFVRALEVATLVEVFAPVRQEFVDYDLPEPPPTVPSPRESEGGGFP
ncbi:MAG: cupin domain-containing protein [Dehalococcoidia bacterium]|nr:cupin domain-containing protein [Dehalococcoidia bacterium]